MELFWIIVALFAAYWLKNGDNTDESDSNSESESDSDYESDEDAIEHATTECVEPIAYSDIPYKRGWSANTHIMVHYPPDMIPEKHQNEDEYYYGKIRRRQGCNFEVYFPQTKNTDVLSPLDRDWHYATDIDITQWDEPQTFTLEKKTLRPFKMQREREGSWSGAQTKRTVATPLRVWSIDGTPYVYVGHLGVYECVSVDSNGTLCPVLGVPDSNYFIGRRKNKKATNFRQFTPLFRVDTEEYSSYDREPVREPTYPTLTRDELH